MAAGFHGRGGMLAGGAGWRRVESPAEECSHAPRQTCGRSERVAKRWRPRNARWASEGAGARGLGAATRGPSETRRPERAEGSPELEMHSKQRSSPPPVLPPPTLPRAPPSPTPKRQPCLAILESGAWADSLALDESSRPGTAPRICQPRSPRACRLPGAATVPSAQE